MRQGVAKGMKGAARAGTLARSSCAAAPGSILVRVAAVLATLAASLAIVLAAAPARAQTVTPSDLPKAAQGIDPVERVGEMLPLNAVFKNSEGEPVRLGDYFKDGKPAILAMVYYRCPVVCGVVMDKLADCMDLLDFTVGKDYRTLVFSFDHNETVAAADAKKTRYLSQYMRMPKDATPEQKAEIAAGWEFHVGTQVANEELGHALGFPFKLLPDGEYSHSVVIFVIAPDGKISRYFYGYDYPPKEMKLALLDASEGKIARTLGERILHYCYRYDPSQGKYVLHPFRVVQIAGGLTVVVLGALIGLLLVGERRRRRLAAAASVAEKNVPETRMNNPPAPSAAPDAGKPEIDPDARPGRRVVVVHEPPAASAGAGARQTPGQKVRG